jgi:hypothetical protein
MLYVIYFILIQAQIALAIAVVWLVMICLYETVAWAILFILFAIFYALLCILDLPFGGAIMRALRCENLPDAWTKISNWHKGNAYTRTFFCSSQCGKGFYPGDLSPFCWRQDSKEPLFSAQQVIYNSFAKANFINDNNNEKLIYSYKPGIKYYTSLTEEQKKNLWSDVFKGRYAYISECNHAYSDFKPLNISICSYFNDVNNTDIPDDIKIKLKDLCQSAFCKQSSDYDFCANKVDDSLIELGLDEKKDYIKLILLSLVVISVLVLIIIFVNQANILPKASTI